MSNEDKIFKEAQEEMRVVFESTEPLESNNLCTVENCNICN